MSCYRLSLSFCVSWYASCCGQGKGWHEPELCRTVEEGKGIFPVNMQPLDTYRPKAGLEALCRVPFWSRSNFRCRLGGKQRSTIDNALTSARVRCNDTQRLAHT
jgi:hypothetical protein